jgi:hypothetical protein
VVLATASKLRASWHMIFDCSGAYNLSMWLFTLSRKGVPLSIPHLGVHEESGRTPELFSRSEKDDHIPVF